MVTYSTLIGDYVKTKCFNETLDLHTRVDVYDKLSSFFMDMLKHANV